MMSDFEMSMIAPPTTGRLAASHDAGGVSRRVSIVVRRFIGAGARDEPGPPYAACSRFLAGMAPYRIPDPNKATSGAGTPYYRGLSALKNPDSRTPNARQSDPLRLPLHTVFACGLENVAD
jgi:hypothetical protein